MLKQVISSVRALYAPNHIVRIKTYFPPKLESISVFVRLIITSVTTSSGDMNVFSTK